MIYLVIFNVTLVFFVELIEGIGGRIFFYLDRWVVEEDETTAKPKQAFLSPEEKESIAETTEAISQLVAKVMN